METQAEGVRVEYLPLSEIERWPRNPKLHDQKALAQSIKRFGFVQPLTVDEATGKLVAGHGRLEALIEMRKTSPEVPERIQKTATGDWLVPVIRGVTFENEREAEAYLVADNRLVEAGGWDQEKLNQILADLSKEGEDVLRGVGWSMSEVDDILREANARVVGQTPEEAAAIYNAGAIKQVVLYFDGKDYDAVLARLQKIMDADPNIKSHTAAFLKLLDHYETTGPQKA